MKRIEIELENVEKPVVIEGEDAGYSIKPVGNTAYLTAWENTTNAEHTVIYPFYRICSVRFSLTK